MEEKTVDSLIKDIVNSVTGTEVTVDEQQASNCSKSGNFMC